MGAATYGCVTKLAMRAGRGVRFMSAFFHDGSATSVTQAIQKHAGQGQAAASAFNGLSNADRSNLLAFLSSL